MLLQDEFLFLSEPQVDQEKSSSENELDNEMKYDRKLTLEDGKRIASGFDWGWSWHWNGGFSNWTREPVTLLGQGLRGQVVWQVAEVA